MSLTDLSRPTADVRRATVVECAVRVVEQARALSAADDDGLRRFLALGQLCHVVVAAELHGVDEDWARLLRGEGAGA